MPEYGFNYWKPQTGSLRRIYIEIDHDFHHPVKLYWEKVNAQDCGLLLHGGYNDIGDFPPLYRDSENPREELAGDALMQYGIDPTEFTWEELLEACC